MSHKKFKTLATLLLTAIFLFTFCFSNLTFATTTSDGLETVVEGVYYIKNSQVEAYLNDLGGVSVVLNSLGEISSFQWEFIYVSNGYYYIKNLESNKYLTAPANSNEGSYVEQASLNTSISSRQLWAIEPVYYGDTIFYIRSQSQESADLYTASSDSLGVYGYNLIQSYDVQFKFNNHWYLEQIQIGSNPKVATLFGISPYDADHDHTSGITYAAESFANANYSTNVFAPTNTTSSNVLSYLQNSDIFIIHTYGYSSSSGTHAYLNDLNSDILSSSDIYNYTTGSHIDMSGCEVAIFASCYSSAHSSKNLPLAATQAGAECAIGFNSEIDCEKLGGCVSEFSYYYLSGLSAEDAINYASSVVGVSQYAIDYYAQGG